MLSRPAARWLVAPAICLLLLAAVPLPAQALPGATYWTGVQAVWHDFGVTGDGDGDPDRFSTNDVVVAVIDTGLDPRHEALRGKIVGWVDITGTSKEPLDGMGHGTAVAGAAAGGRIGGYSHRGVAPGAALVGLRLDEMQEGALVNLDEWLGLKLVEALQWVRDHHEQYGIRVVNLSMGPTSLLWFGVSADTNARIEAQMKALAAAGVLVVVAAGNDGPASGTLGNVWENALVVGASSDPHRGGWSISPFSSRGVQADRYPDVVAPGVELQLPVAGSRNSYAPMSGTSFASPFVAGVAALMFAANPDLTPAGARELLRQTAIDLGPPGSDPVFGSGLVDAYGAVRAAWQQTGKPLPPSTRPPLPEYAAEYSNLADGASTATHLIRVPAGAHNLAVNVLPQEWPRLYGDLESRLVGRRGNYLGLWLELLSPGLKRVTGVTNPVSRKVPGSGTLEVRRLQSGDYFLQFGPMQAVPGGLGPYHVAVSYQVAAGPYQAQWLQVDAPPKLASGRTTVVRAQLVNTGWENWASLTARGAALRYDWLQGDARLTAAAQATFMQTGALEPGMVANLDLMVRAPQAPGSYTLELVLEFPDAEGQLAAPPATFRLPVTVRR